MDMHDSFVSHSSLGDTELKSTNRSTFREHEMYEDMKVRHVFYQKSNFQTISKREQRKQFFQKQKNDTKTDATHNRKQQASKVGEHNIGLRVATVGRAQSGLTKAETDAQNYAKNTIDIIKRGKKKN